MCANKTETFIEKARKKHGDTYDYSLVDYKNNATKITLICKTHGEFEITPAYHLRGGYCSYCAKENVKNYWTPERREAQRRKMQSEEVLEKRRQTNREKYGADSWAKSDEAKEKHENGEGPWSEDARKKAQSTNIENYGAKTWAESETGRETLAEIFSSDEARQAMSERASSKEARENYKNTSRKNHRADHWSQSDEGKARLKALFNTPEERLKRSQRMLSKSVREKIEQTSMERYGVPYYWQSEAGRERLSRLLTSEEVVNKTKMTNLERYGSESWANSVIGRQRLREILSSDEVQAKTIKTNLERYGAVNWSLSDIGLKFLSSDENIRNIIETKRKNGTLNYSQPEEDLYEMLCDHYGNDDVFRQYNLDDRYPYNCDFYIKSLDLFIELNGTWLHGGSWFNAESEDHIAKVQLWLSKGKPMYDRGVEIWTISDVKKRECAKKNNLNYVVLWDVKLSDARDWFDAGCPVRKDWA